MPADHVICTNCDAESYVLIGDEICPNCKKEGCLAWVNYDKPEEEVYRFEIISIGGIRCNQY